MKRHNNRWKQDNPRDQLRVILGVLHGHILNIKDGDADPVKRIDQCESLIKEAYVLAENLPTGEWDKEGE